MLTSFTALNIASKH